MFATPLGNPAFGGEKDSEAVIKATSFIKSFSFLKNIIIFFIESSLKLMGNAFYFILKALFIL